MTSEGAPETSANVKGVPPCPAQTYGRLMDDTNRAQTTTNPSDEERQRTEALSDGSPNGDSGDADTSSGGAPEDPDKTDPDGTPVENPSG